MSNSPVERGSSKPVPEGVLPIYVVTAQCLPPDTDDYTEVVPAWRSAAHLQISYQPGTDLIATIQAHPTWPQLTAEHDQNCKASTHHVVPSYFVI